MAIGIFETSENQWVIWEMQSSRVLGVLGVLDGARPCSALWPGKGAYVPSAFPFAISQNRIFLRQEAARASAISRLAESGQPMD